MARRSNKKVPHLDARRHRASLNRSGVSLVEMLTVLAVVGLLVGLLLPAVQATRERARKAHCSNNLRQFGVALHSFESVYDRFPPIDINNIPPGGSLTVVRNPHFPSAHYFLLPSLGQGDLYGSIDLDGDYWDSGSDPPTTTKNGGAMTRSIPVFICPSDRVPPGATSYLISEGTLSGIMTPELAPPNSALPGLGSTTSGKRGSEVTDGHSQTVAFSERLVGDNDPATYTPWRDLAYVTPPTVPPPYLPDELVNLCSSFVGPAQPHASYVGTGWLFHRVSCSSYNHMFSPNSRIPDCSLAPNRSGPTAYTSRSLHSQGAFSLYVDGAVRFTNESIDNAVWRAIGTISGGEREQAP